MDIFLTNKVCRGSRCWECHHKKQHTFQSPIPSPPRPKKARIQPARSGMQQEPDIIDNENENLWPGSPRRRVANKPSAKPSWESSETGTRLRSPVRGATRNDDLLTSWESMENGPSSSPQRQPTNQPVVASYDKRENKLPGYPTKRGTRRVEIDESPGLQPCRHHDHHLRRRTRNPNTDRCVPVVRALN